MVRTVRFEPTTDGTLVLHESRRFLRGFLFAAALVLIVIVVAAVAGDSSNWKLLAGGLAGALGLMLLAAVLSDLRIAFDVVQERLTWEQRNVFRSRRVGVPFSAVRDVFVLESASRDDDNRVGGYVVTYRSMLRTTTETLPLSMSEGADKADSQALCDAVLKIIVRDPSSLNARSLLEQTLLAGRLIDAIALIRAQRGVSLEEARRIAEAMAAKAGSSPESGAG